MFDKKAKESITEAIREAEGSTGGEIRVHVQRSCGQDALVDARKVFKRLKMHQTYQKNAVLIFVAFKSKRFAILGDEGIHQRVGEDFWKSTRDTMRGHFLKNDFLSGILAGIHSVGGKLKQHFPATLRDVDELSNNVSED